MWKIISLNWMGLLNLFYEAKLLTCVMKTLKQTYIIGAPIEKVWEALVDPKVIDDWGGGPAKMSPEEGFEFEVWGGDIWGKNLKVVPGKQLVQEWTAGQWDKPSKVTFKLSEQGGKTKVDLLHEDVPDSEVDEIDDGWERYYLGPLKGFLEH